MTIEADVRKQGQTEGTKVGIQDDRDMPAETLGCGSQSPARTGSGS